jgi:pimeloyl-ACP methyl ester carboxylesterase
MSVNRVTPARPMGTPLLSRTQNCLRPPEVAIRDHSLSNLTGLLHGHPGTSGTWHRVPPALVTQGLTVVCAEMPGFSRSGIHSPGDSDPGACVLPPPAGA